MSAFHHLQLLIHRPARLPGFRLQILPGRNAPARCVGRPVSLGLLHTLSRERFFTVLFTIELTLPHFPASIGESDGYPLPCLAL
jgi:hypothetical protein